MDILLLGLIAGTITSSGFIPQLVKGYRTKKLEDVSYFMPLMLAFGTLMWLFYGIFQNDFAIIAANTFAVGCNISLILMKRYYENSIRSHNI